MMLPNIIKKCMIKPIRKLESQIRKDVCDVMKMQNEIRSKWNPELLQKLRRRSFSKGQHYALNIFAYIFQWIYLTPFR